MSGYPQPVYPQPPYPQAAYPQPGYQPIQQQPRYSPLQIQQNQPVYPNYPNYPQQLFPTPVQQQAPGYVQPQPIQWMNSNFQTYLTRATAFNVTQKVEVLEILTGWETENKYSVKDQAGNKIFYVVEESSCLSRICCGRVRPFQLLVKDNQGQTVMTFSRDFDCGAIFCGFICGDSVKVTAPGGQNLGTVDEVGSCCYPLFDIKSPLGTTSLRLEGPMCVCGQVAFKVLDINDVQVGSIRKEWGGVVRELFTDADTFSVTFPPNADPATKASLLAALFMIDFHYFEQGPSGRQGGRRFFS